MSDRISTTFSRLKKQGRKAFVGYLTAGDPDMRRSEADIRTAIRHGVDILELGVPFSDPTADGPVIQAASQRSLAAGTTLEKVLNLVCRLRKDLDLPIILFGYANPFFSYGYKRLCAGAADAGVDGLLVVDMPFEEMNELLRFSAPRGLALIRIIAPTTPPQRARRILADADGFVYYIMVTGVTGARKTISAGIGRHMAVLRRATALPIVVGFGISNGRQARLAASSANGAVVGSALVKAARDGKLAPLVRDIRRALD